MDLTRCELPGIPKIGSGKVREIFDLGKHLLLVATDRLSAFDVVFTEPIPGKGAVLTQMSRFWFERCSFAQNHLVTAEFREFPRELQRFQRELMGRSMVVQKAKPLPVECVARGYLAGSGWREYQQSQTVGGIPLPPGLQQADQLPEPIFTPATKAVEGHDENINWQQCCEILGPALAEQVRELTLQLYSEGRAYAAGRGIIVADTKFEFGMLDGGLILIDECLTPDSSRFWPADEYRLGTSPPSFDKQFVRDYLETLDWDKSPPAPELPADVIQKTSAKYHEAYRRLTGEELTLE